MTAVLGRETHDGGSLVMLASARNSIRVPRRFFTRRDRILFTAIGVAAVGIGVMFLLDHTADHQVWFDNLWNVLFISGGAATVLYAHRFGSWMLRATSNALLVVGSAGRGAGHLLAVLRLVGWIRDSVPTAGTSIPSALGGVFVYWLLALALFVVWRSRLPADGWPHDAH